MSLLKEGNKLSSPNLQLQVINESSEYLSELPKFGEKLQEDNLLPFKPTGISIFQMNVGYMCNQTCKHCHVDAGPDRKEIMTRETMQHCLDALEGTDINTVDLTGGAPEMNPNFQWFVEQVTDMGKHVIVRTALTILTTTPKYRTYPKFLAERGVEMVASLPYYIQNRTDRVRGDGVFKKSIEALQMLNEVGYAQYGSGLELNLAYNPTGAFLPTNQLELEAEFRRVLKDRYDIQFNNLFAITNLPISRFLDYLIQSDNLDLYMERLVNAYNPAAAANVMCRNTISIGWDGYLYDCDFNQMLDMKLEDDVPQHIADWDEVALNNRQIRINQHCYGCTAGSGSSCGGTVA